MPCIMGKLHIQPGKGAETTKIMLRKEVPARQPLIMILPGDGWTASEALSGAREGGEERKSW